MAVISRTSRVDLPASRVGRLGRVLMDGSVTLKVWQQSSMAVRLASIVVTLIAYATNPTLAQPAAVPKSNPTKVYMHVMPWYDTPEVLGPNRWGLHWTMANQDPNIVDATGRRQIASHFYPKIGPYQSSNPHVIEYHLLLMKLSGVDGVLIDWYGVAGTNGDIGRLLSNSNAIVEQVDDFGLGFGVMLEDRFSTTSHGNGIPDVDKAKANIAYLRDNYFNRTEYIRHGIEQNPLLTVFGPITFEQPSQWNEILGEAGEDVDFLTLWYQANDAGPEADGEYAWIYEDESLDNHLNHVANFYRSRAPALQQVGGIAYPGFFDFYDEGGWSGISFEIPHDDGQTLADTLDVAGQYNAELDFLQLATWNDFGEGTMFEPTVETGFDYLEQLQRFTGVPYGVDELQLVYRLYLSRQKYSADPAMQANLDQVAALLAALQISDARRVLDAVAPRGDYDADGDVDIGDYTVWYTEFGRQSVVHGIGADGNYNGLVDAADFTVWRDSLDVHLTLTVPEPSSVFLTGLVLLAAVLSRR